MADSSLDDFFAKKDKSKKKTKSKFTASSTTTGVDDCQPKPDEEPKKLKKKKPKDNEDSDETTKTTKPGVVIHLQNIYKFITTLKITTIMNLRQFWKHMAWLEGAMFAGRHAPSCHAMAMHA